jgi:hypothetical protein
MKKKFLVLLLLPFLLVGPGADKEANSFALAVAPAVMMNVASALVVGGAMYYCWTHGGEESWAQLQSATKEGIEVTKDWIINKIAEDNGVDTSGPNYNTPDNPYQQNFIFYPGAPLEVGMQFYIYNYKHDRDELWEITSSGVSFCTSWMSAPEPAYACRVAIPNDYTRRIDQKNSNAAGNCGKGWNCSLLTYQEPPGFDPTAYPNLYGPQVLYANAYNALMDGIPPVLDWIMLDDAPAIDPDKDQVATVPVVAGVDANATVNPWGSDAILGEDGKYYPAPPALVDPDTGLPLERPWPELDGASVGGNVVEGVNGVAPINKPLDQLLNDAGIVGGTINGVQGNTITWTDADGVSHVAVVPNDVADQVRDLAETTGAASDAKENTQKNIEKETALLTDPGHIDVPFFDPEFEQPEKQDVATVMDTLIDLLPGADLLTDSSIEASGSPVMTLTFPGFDPVNLDFSSYESNVSSIGSILFTIVCLGCLIAVVKG